MILRIKNNFIDIVLIFLLLLFSPLFFYQLGASSLVSWDEAWYAEIARNILLRKDFINLSWNGSVYFDHPPTGFVLMALSFLIHGVSEFSTRFMSALVGISSMIVLYLLGKELFSRVGGFFAATTLPSAFWFLYRSRSGNLDIFLTFFFILTFYFAWLSLKNKKFLIPFSISLGLLFLTKSVVPFTILPALFVIFWKNKKIKLSDFKKPLIIFFIFVGGWFLSQIIQHHYFFIANYFKIGLPSVDLENNYIENIKLTKRYIYEGIGRWFWPAVFSLGISTLFRERRFLFLTVFWVTFTVPFIFSHRGGIWHLIPLHPFMLLSLFGFIDVALSKLYIYKMLTIVLCLILSFYISFPQLKRSWYEFIAVPPFISDEQILSAEAGKYPYPLYITGYNFAPAAVFYSKKEIPQQLYVDYIPNKFSSDESFMMIGYERELQEYVSASSSAEILKKDRDKVLILKK